MTGTHKICARMLISKVANLGVEIHDAKHTTRNKKAIARKAIPVPSNALCCLRES